jgi:drug/metabolite transporter superfamily protein YnfA
MTPVIVLPMIWARSGKVPQRAAWVGAIMAVCGTALISV